MCGHKGAAPGDAVTEPPTPAACTAFVVGNKESAPHKPSRETMVAPKSEQAKRAHGLAVVGRVRARLETLTERMVAYYRKEVPGYGALPQPVMADVRAVSRGNVEAFLAGLEGAREPSEKELELVREGAVRRARQGIALTNLLHAYRTGTRIVWEAVLEEVEAGTSAEREAAGKLAAALFAYLDRVSTAVEEAYLAEWEVRIHRTALHRWKLANELLVDPEPSRVRALGREAGVALPDEIVVVALPVDKQLPPDAEQDLPGFAAEIQSRSVLFLDAAFAERSLAALADRLRCALGRGEGRRWVEGLAPSFADACKLADLASRLGLRGCISNDALLVERMLSSDPEVAETLFQRIFGRLLSNDPSGTLCETVEAYLDADGSLTAAAEKLLVHPNTVAYRLGRADKVGGLKLDSPEARFEALLAVKARRLVRETTNGPQRGEPDSRKRRSEPRVPADAGQDAVPHS